MIENPQELNLEGPMQYQPRYMKWYMDHVCTHVPHLDLVDIGQNMSATDRLIGTPNPMKKFSNHSTLRPQNPKIHGNVPQFRPRKNFFILTLHTHEQSLD